MTCPTSADMPPKPGAPPGGGHMGRLPPAVVREVFDVLSGRQPACPPRRAPGPFPRGPTRSRTCLPSCCSRRPANRRSTAENVCPGHWLHHAQGPPRNAATTFVLRHPDPTVQSDLDRSHASPSRAATCLRLPACRHRCYPRTGQSPYGSGRLECCNLSPLRASSFRG